MNILVRGSDQHDGFRGQAVSDLTRYELGSVVWKKTKGDHDETMSLFRTCPGFLSQTRSLTADGVEDVAGTTACQGLTFYDSAYVVVAKRYGLELVADDKKMLKAARRSGIVAVRSGVRRGP